jgi:apolipoprotein N-acyltransferase
MNTTASLLATGGSVDAPAPVEAREVSWRRAIVLAGGATVAFHLAYAVPPLSFLIVVYLYGLVQLSGLPTGRRAFYFGLAIGYAVYAPHLMFFWTIFGWPAVALWTVLAFWLGLFVALARLCRLKFGRASLLLIPFLWTGLEYFRSELYYLRFSWLSVGYAFSEVAPALAFTGLGVYGVGFLLMAVVAALAIQTTPKRLGFAFAFVLLLAGLVNGGFAFALADAKAGKSVHVVGLQMEYPNDADLLLELNKLAARDNSSDLVVLSEYTLQRPPTDELKAWCRMNNRYLAVGGKDFVSDSRFYNTLFVVDPHGEIVFRQAKSVPIQFFDDGLPARTQELWESPWGKIGFCICYDASYQRVTDSLVRLGAQAIIIPTADESSWGKAEHFLHARIAPIRAAEYRVPIFRVACTGISQWVDRSGRVRASAPYPGQGETLTAEIAFGDSGRFPLDHWLAPLSVLVTAVTIFWLTLKRILERFSTL